MLEVLASALRLKKKKKVKGTQIWKEKIQLSLFTDGLIDNIENSKESTKKKGRKEETHITEFSKVVGFKINIQKSIIYLHTKNGHQNVKDNTQKVK